MEAQHLRFSIQVLITIIGAQTILRPGWLPCAEISHERLLGFRWEMAILAGK